MTFCCSCHFFLFNMIVDANINYIKHFVWKLQYENQWEFESSIIISRNLLINFIFLICNVTRFAWIAVEGIPLESFVWYVKCLIVVVPSLRMKTIYLRLIHTRREGALSCSSCWVVQEFLILGCSRGFFQQMSFFERLMSFSVFFLVFKAHSFLSTFIVRLWGCFIVLNMMSWWWIFRNELIWWTRITYMMNWWEIFFSELIWWARFTWDRRSLHWRVVFCRCHVRVRRHLTNLIRCILFFFAWYFHGEIFRIVLRWKCFRHHMSLV